MCSMKTCRRRNVRIDLSKCTNCTLFTNSRTFEGLSILVKDIRISAQLFSSSLMILLNLPCEVRWRWKIPNLMKNLTWHLSEMERVKVIFTKCDIWTIWERVVLSHVAFTQRLPVIGLTLCYFFYFYDASTHF